ncbi:hypothetical protein [Turicibacter sanguinis]|uniref:hypothetical protein n=1 Tax=Turicibacter sanguinis TaxID=154288 RepID=UPI002330919F|nr:hypothetical protein [Turicibacter sanguinis]MDB8575176.1 hypothetical protein [Turicibacter sanguinis]MDB8577283.1 hypothetical protein [Turicibacter sanguinis]MDB8583827.1 hypothetical protein [Turicibacter sanguinis]MDB8586611.1 hypothetical protein [Turicibacter sanguinis]MDB8597547.1 hypothetical protein [Turicibacter sanguinis]
MLKALMQKPPTIEALVYDNKLVVRLNGTFDFEYIFSTSQLKVYIPAPKENKKPRLLHDDIILSFDEKENILTYIKAYFRLNQKEMIREIVDGKSEIPIRPTI